MEAPSEDEFARLVEDSLETLPGELLAPLENLAIVIEDEHPLEPLLGLYEGLPLTERGDDPFGWPDQITLYRLTLAATCESADELADQVRVTVVHELAHHLGIDDQRLDELGWA